MIENNIIVVRFRAKEVYGIVELLWNVKLITRQDLWSTCNEAWRVYVSSWK